jgi:hypothetical protein
MRKYYFDRFGAGQPEILAERTRIYLLGMPGKDGEVFPPRCNMETKLDLLETEREYLLEMCPWLNSQQKRLISPIFDGQKNNATDNLSLM